MIKKSKLVYWIEENYDYVYLYIMQPNVIEELYCDYNKENIYHCYKENIIEKNSVNNLIKKVNEFIEKWEKNNAIRINKSKAKHIIKEKLKDYKIKENDFELF